MSTEGAEFESGLDEQLDLAGEGLRSPDELDLAQDRQDRQVETAGAEPDKGQEAEEERFEYELADGTKVEGTFAEIVAKVTETQEAKPEGDSALEERIKELEAKLEQAAKPQEQAKTDDGQGVQPVDWNESGNLLAGCLGMDISEMSQSEKQALNNVGPILQDAINREVLTSPAIAQILGSFITSEVTRMLTDREATGKRESSFSEFVGTAAEEAEVSKFMKDNPWATTREMAVLGIKTAKLNQEIADLKQGKDKGVQDAETKGRQQALKDLKAKGQLRRVSGSTPGSTQTTQGATQSFKNENDRLNAWTGKLKELEHNRAVR